MKTLTKSITYLCLFAIILSCFAFVGCKKTQEVPLTDKTSLVGLPGQEISLSVTNPDALPINLDVADYSLMSVTVTSSEQVVVKLLKEGTGSFGISLSDGATQQISVECMDLRITTVPDHVDVGQSLDITLSHEVDASYHVEGDCATVEGNRVTAHAEGSFRVVVTYGDIMLTKEMDSYPRSATLTGFNRDDDYIRYYGRNVHQSGSVIMNNIASGFEVSFYGTSLWADLDAWFGSWYGYTRLSVLVDGETDTSDRVVILDHGTTKTEYPLVTGLTEGVHTVKVLKRTEALSTSMTLYQLRTDGYFKPVTQEEKLKIEAYGDSITAGYGNLRGDLADTTSSEYQSGLETYATYTAWALNAEINVQARSGIGMYTSSGIDDTKQVNTGYRYTTYDQAYLWNFENYIPDIVIINLGTNDMWNGSVFNGDTFVAEYVSFVKELAEIYGEKTAFILVSGLMEQGVDAYVRQVQEVLKNELSNPVIRYRFTQCEAGHPLVSEHLAASEELVAILESAGLTEPNIPSREEEVTPPATGENVDCTLRVRLTDELASHVTLWVTGIGQPRVLEKADPLTYELSLTLPEGDYTLSFCLNGDISYAEAGEGHLVRIRKAYTEYVVTPFGFPIVPEDADPHAETNGWWMSTALFPASFTTTDRQSVTVSNASNWMAAFVTRRSAYGDNYLLQVDLATEAFSNREGTYLGVVPYYVDDHNYIVCYLQFKADGTLKSLGCTGASNGTSLGWMDFWSFADLSLDVTQGVHLEFARNGANLTASIGGVTETQKIAKMQGDTGEVGVWSICENPVRYTAFSQTEKQSDADADASKWTSSPAAFDTSFTENADGSVSCSNQNWLAGYVITDAPAVDHYFIEATVSASEDGYTAADDKYIGLVAFYADSNNNVAVYLQWDAQNCLKSIGCTGLIGGESIGWHDLWEFAGQETHLKTGDTLRVGRSGKTLTVTFGGVTASTTIDELNDLACDSVGLWCCKTACTFGNIRIGETSL